MLEQIAEALINAAAALLSPAAQVCWPAVSWGAALLAPKRLHGLGREAACGCVVAGVDADGPSNNPGSQSLPPIGNMLLPAIHPGLMAQPDGTALAPALCCSQAELGYEGQHEEFALTLCETMATLGSQHLAAISKPGGGF